MGRRRFIITSLFLALFVLVYTPPYLGTKPHLKPYLPYLGVCRPRLFCQQGRIKPPAPLTFQTHC